MTFADQQAAWNLWLSTHSVSVAGGAAKHLCPLCPEDHVTCQFEAGSLECKSKSCLNPHCRRSR